MSMSDSKIVLVPPLPRVAAWREVDGIDMAVLDDGTPFLTGRGLAALAGIAPSVLIEWNWSRDSQRPRDKKLTEILEAHAFTGESLFRRALNGQAEVHAYSDVVCIAVVEYYAFEGREQARNALRRLAQRTLRDLIYSSVGYDPHGLIPGNWKHFHERLLLNPVPRGKFSVFREVADIIVSAIRAGLRVDHHTVPDGSVGRVWSAHWAKIAGDDKYGPRAKHPHVFPDDSPQSAADIDAWVYPLAALGEFRQWLQDVYLPEKYPRYIQSKVRSGALLASRAELLLAAVNPTDEPKALGEPDSAKK